MWYFFILFIYFEMMTLLRSLLLFLGFFFFFLLRWWVRGNASWSNKKSACGFNLKPIKACGETKVLHLEAWWVRVDSEDICHLTYILRSYCQLHYYILTVTCPLAAAIFWLESVSPLAVFLSFCSRGPNWSSPSNQKQMFLGDIFRREMAEGPLMFHLFLHQLLLHH